MNQILSQTHSSSPHFQVSTTFFSFDKLKTSGAQSLESLTGGKIAKLETKTGRYVILNESDFQALHGLAQDVQRLSMGLELVLTAAQAVEAHGDQLSITMLLQAVRVVGRVPVLPTQTGHSQAQPENLDIEDDGSIDFSAPTPRH